MYSFIVYFIICREVRTFLTKCTVHPRRYAYDSTLLFDFGGFYPYPTGLFHWHRCNLRVPLKQTWAPQMSFRGISFSVTNVIWFLQTLYCISVTMSTPSANSEPHENSFDKPSAPPPLSPPHPHPHPPPTHPHTPTPTPTWLNKSDESTMHNDLIAKPQQNNARQNPMHIIWGIQYEYKNVTKKIIPPDKLAIIRNLAGYCHPRYCCQVPEFLFRNFGLQNPWGMGISYQPKISSLLGHNVFAFFLTLKVFVYSKGRITVACNFISPLFLVVNLCSSCKASRSYRSLRWTKFLSPFATLTQNEIFFSSGVYS